MNTSEIPYPGSGEAWEALALEPLDGADADILDRVARLYSELDPVPDDLVERLQFAISLNALEVELAVLQLSSGEQLAARAEPTSAVKTLTFTSDSLTTTVNISPDGPDRLRIDGWIAPATAAVVELYQGAECWEVSADGDGRFVFADVQHGLTRFLIRAGSDVAPLPVATPAVEI
jgi:hypothetical protein